MVETVMLPVPLRYRWLAISLLMFVFGAGILAIYILHHPVTVLLENKEHLRDQAKNYLPGKSGEEVIALLGNPDRIFPLKSKKQCLAYFLRRESNPYSGIDSVWLYVEIDESTDTVTTVTIGTD